MIFFRLRFSFLFRPFLRGLMALASRRSDTVVRAGATQKSRDGKYLPTLRYELKLNETLKGIEIEYTPRYSLLLPTRDMPFTWG